MIEEIKSQNNLALENIKNQLAQITEKREKRRAKIHEYRTNLTHS